MSLNPAGKKLQSVNVGKSKVVLRFYDGSKLDISGNTYSEFKLYPNKEISDKELKKIKERNELDKFYQYAFTSASKSEQSEKQIRDKLTKKGAKKKQIDFIINELNKYSLISEESVINNYLDYASYKLYGENRIKEDLINKGISLDKVNSLEFSYSDEIKKAKELLIKLEKKYSKQAYSTKKKHIYDALIRYGYSFDIASKIVEEVKPNSPKEELEILKKEHKKAKERYSHKYKSKELETKVINYLLGKGYRYNDILKLKGE